MCSNYHSAKAPPPTHVLGCQCLALRQYKRQAVQSFELLVSPAAALWHPQLRKTCSKRAFPLPRAHMHTHAASERADTHMCLTRKQARHLPDNLCGLTRARDHRSARVAARKQASQNCEVATAACTTARTAGQTLPATAPKYAGMALRTLRYLPGPCTQGARAGAHLTVSPRASVEGARRVLAMPEGARRGGPPPAWSSLMGLLRPPWPRVRRCASRVSASDGIACARVLLSFALRPRRPRFSLVKATLLVRILISGFGSF
jgi:hypothetical protein